MMMKSKIISIVRRGKEYAIMGDKSGYIYHEGSIEDCKKMMNLHNITYFEENERWLIGPDKEKKNERKIQKQEIQQKH